MGNYRIPSILCALTLILAGCGGADEANPQAAVAGGGGERDSFREVDETPGDGETGDVTDEDNPNGDGNEVDPHFKFLFNQFCISLQFK